jgi:hypothetical protein
MRMDGWMDMTKLIVAFRNFVNAPEKGDQLVLTFNFDTHISLSHRDYDFSN